MNTSGTTTTTSSSRARGGSVSWGVSVTITLAFYAGALGAFRWAAAQRTGTPVLVVGVVVAACDLVLRRLVRPPRVEGRADLVRRLGAPLGGVVLGVLFVALWWWRGLDDGWGVLGAAIAYFGAGQALTELRASQLFAPWRGPLVLALCGLAVAVGLASASRLGFNLPIVLLAGGVLLVPVGLALLSEDVLARSGSWSPTISRTVGVVGLALLAAGFVLLLVLHAPRWPLLIGAILLLVLVGAIASDNETDVIIVISVVVLVWALSPRDVALEGPVVPVAGAPIVAALGDSFMSGEGAPRFFSGTNDKDDNECRRAPTAYTLLVAERRGSTVAFVACSGARAEHLVRSGQYRREPIRLPGLTPDDAEVPERLAQTAHLDWIVDQVGESPGLVLVSIGGNDALFGHIATTCVLPGDCSVLGQRWLNHLAGVEVTLDRAYAELRLALDASLPGRPVVVVPYPNPINPDGCSWSALTDDEHRFLHGFTGELNAVIRSAAERAGFRVLEEMEEALGERQLRLCDAGANRVGVNFLAANPVAGLIRQRANPINWFHNSLHPNPRGHEAMADTLDAWLDANPSLEPLAAAGGGTPHPVATVEELMGDPDFDHCGRPDTAERFCSERTEDWRFDHTLRVVRLGVVPVVTMAVGSWLIWLPLLQRWRRRQAEMLPSDDVG